MLTVVKAHEVDTDLDEIWLYIAADKPAAADATVDRIVSTFFKLAEFPNIGTHSEYLPSGLLRFPVGNYLIFYRIAPDQLEIARVLHGAQKLEASFQ